MRVKETKKMKTFIPNLRQLGGLVMIINTLLPLIFIVVIWLIVDALNEDICKTVKNTKEILKIYDQSEQYNTTQTKEIDCGLFDLAESIYKPFAKEIKIIGSEIDTLNDKFKILEDGKSKFDEKIKKLNKVHLQEINIELSPDYPKRPKKLKTFSKDIVSKINDLDNQINDNIVSPLTGQINQIPYTVKSVADIMVNPQAGNIYQKIKNIESKWIKTRDDLNNYLFTPLKLYYQEWKSIFLVVFWIALIWISMTYFLWVYRRLSVGWGLLLNR
jgi:hypothetical protein